MLRHILTMPTPEQRPRWDEDTQEAFDFANEVLASPAPYLGDTQPSLPVVVPLEEIELPLNLAYPNHWRVRLNAAQLKAAKKHFRTEKVSQHFAQQSLEDMEALFAVLFNEIKAKIPDLGKQAYFMEWLLVSEPDACVSNFMAYLLNNGVRDVADVDIYIKQFRAASLWLTVWYLHHFQPLVYPTQQVNHDYSDFE